MKRILGALLVASALLGSYAQAEKAPAKKTKWVCTIGLEGEGSFKEVYKTRQECKQLCKGDAAICQEEEATTPVNLEEVD